MTDILINNTCFTNKNDNDDENWIIKESVEKFFK